MKNGSNQSKQEAQIEVCSMCGSVNGDLWQTQPTRPVHLHLGPRPGDPAQSWTLCDECKEGLRGLTRQRKHSHAQPH
jgi:hypothetical protein